MTRVSGRGVMSRMATRDFRLGRNVKSDIRIYRGVNLLKIWVRWKMRVVECRFIKRRGFDEVFMEPLELRGHYFLKCFDLLRGFML